MCIHLVPVFFHIRVTTGSLQVPSGDCCVAKAKGESIEEDGTQEECAMLAGEEGAMGREGDGMEGDTPVFLLVETI